MQNGSQGVSFTNNGGAIVGEISGGGMEYGIDLDYLDNTMMTFDAMGFEHGLDATTLQGGRLPAARVFRARGRQPMAPHLSRCGTRFDCAHHH